MRGVYYKYNAETDNFERIYPTVWGRLRTVFLLVMGGGIIAVIVYLLCYYSFGTPAERHLRDENIKLRREYGMLKRRMDQAIQVLRKIEDRDRKIYRILLQNDSVVYRPAFMSYQSNVKRNELQDINVPAIVRVFNNDVELLEERLYEQIQSFGELENQLKTLEGEISIIPSILPIERRYAEISGTFGLNLDLGHNSKFHEGIDFIVPVGIPVYATAHGKVIDIYKSGSGFTVVIRHSPDYKSLYSHLGEVIVKQGQEVLRGEVIGFVGDTEKSSASSPLHYEVRYKDRAENPLNYFYLDFTPEEYEEYLLRAEDATKVID